jgi:hypothetical protein
MLVTKVELPQLSFSGSLPSQERKNNIIDDDDGR